MSKYSKQGAKPDGGQDKIVKALRKLGAKVVIVSVVNNFCDLLVGFKGNLYLMEVKDGTKPPSQRKLTPGEIKCQREFELVGVDYHIINSVEEAIDLVVGNCDVIDKCETCGGDNSELGFCAKCDTDTYSH